MARQSEKLHPDFENLCYVISEFGKTMLSLGPFPPLLRERFSCLLILNSWLRHFCLAAGYNYIGNFDYFVTKHDLYKRDGLHLNMERVVELISNLINFIACGL